MPRSSVNSRSRPVRILGLDPGLTRTGYAIVTIRNRQPELETFGCIMTEHVPDYEQRLLTLEQKLTALIAKHQPTSAALEQLFITKNLKTAISVGQARGVIVLTLARHKLSIQEFTPQQVKIAVTGYGHAEKQQVQRMVQLLFHLKEVPKPDDAADAVAVAVAGALTLRTRIQT